MSAVDEPEQRTRNGDRWQRYAGALVGLAVGDALGAPVEGAAPHSFAPVQDMRHDPESGLAPGEWTDDTAMALCLAMSLIECGGSDPRDQMDRYLRWHEEGYLSATGRSIGIGNTVFGALQRYREGGEPLGGLTDPFTAGNGSLMRLAPVPMAWAHDFGQCVEHAALSSRTTHGATEAVDACRFYAGLIHGALNGESRERLLSPCYAPEPDYWTAHPLAPAIDAIARGTYRHRSPPDIRGTAYVVESLEAALWAFHNSDNFRDGALLAVNLGNDTDTTAAIYGQLAGAFYGLEAIPEQWRNEIQRRELIMELAGGLAELSTQLGNNARA